MERSKTGTQTHGHDFTHIRLDFFFQLVCLGVVLPSGGENAKSQLFALLIQNGYKWMACFANFFLS